MARKVIVWSRSANLELRSILEFYNQRNGNTNYSLKLLSEIESLLDTLSQSEGIGRLTINKKTRVVVMKVYLVFYEINKDLVEIIHVTSKRYNQY